jgi:hypothetical protein
MPIPALLAPASAVDGSRPFNPQDIRVHHGSALRLDTDDP